MKYITKTVWLLSLISLLTDAASEMLYPIMPIYLKHIGFSIVLIGILEGLAESVAGLSKGYFGKLSDIKGKRVPFVQWGYALSAISKPLMAVFIFPLWVFFARTLDRIGKGIRSGARDALLSNETNAANKGKVFGFHRSMDTMGAAIGPALALLYLYFYPGDYKTLFFIAFFPGLLAIVASYFLKEKVVGEKSVGEKVVDKKIGFFSFLGYWKESPLAYKRLIIGLLFFALINSSDVFLLLRAKELGFSDSMVIGVYIFYNLVYALFAYPMGIVADNIGLKKVFLFGLLIFSIVYFGMALNTEQYILIGLFFLYGVYASTTEGIAKAWISNISLRKDTGTAIGTYSGFQSIATFLASTFTGIIWFNFGSMVAFLVIGVFSLLVLFYFLINNIKESS